jgi:malonyl-CoA/methylmalonyl-CoA synthetase
VSNAYDGPRLPGRVGWALPGIEVRLDGDDGEILVRGPQVFEGYWRRPDATAEALTGDGWFRTGDLGRLDDEDGSLEITGRSKELIISGGLNVYPREVAFVVAAGDLDADALIAHARERLSAYKCPKRVVALDELPVNRMGKVRRDALVEMAN